MKSHLLLKVTDNGWLLMEGAVFFWMLTQGLPILQKMDSPTLLHTQEPLSGVSELFKKHIKLGGKSWSREGIGGDGWAVDG